MRQISERGLDHIKRWEGLRLRAYQDTGDVWTIGYGHTKTAKPGMTITEPEAERLLMQDVGWAQEAVSELVDVPLSQHQYDAMVDFMFNIGEEQFGESTLLKRLDASDYDAVPDELRRWVYDNGKYIKGLANRREATIALWKHPSAKTRVTPAASRTVQVSVLQALTGGATALGGVFAGISDLGETAQIAIIVAGAAVTCMSLFILRERLKAWADGWR